MLHGAKGPPHNSFECFDERRMAGMGRRVPRENPSGFIRPVSLHRVFEVCMFLRGLSGHYDGRPRSWSLVLLSERAE